MFKKRYNIISRDWDVITRLRLSETPRANEMIYIEETNKYYFVLNVIHRETLFLNTTYIVVEEVTKKN